MLGYTLNVSLAIDCFTALNEFALMLIDAS